jgi:senataxin
MANSPESLNHPSCDSIQYRMHPEISVLPSTLFYAGQLLDGPDMARKRAKPWHVNKLFAPYRFFSVKEGHEESAKSGFSLVNRSEVDVALALYSRLMMEYGKNIVDLKIGIVTMYKAQMLELKRRFQDKEGKSVLSKVDFNTVDGFQGQEKDIIILSCVRAGPNVQSVGFLSDYRRMNVALTRSRSSLFILGHAPTLERSDPVWKQIVQNARERSCFFDVSSYPFLYLVKLNRLENR